MKNKIWLLIPVITVIIVTATIAFLYFQPINQPGLSPPQEKTTQYTDYLGKWIHGETAFEEALPDQGGTMIEIREIRGQFIKGTLTEVLMGRANHPNVYTFSGRVDGTRAEIKYDDEKSKQHSGVIAFKEDKIGVRLNIDPLSKHAQREMVFGRALMRVKTPDFQDILNYINLSRGEIVNKLGPDYKVFPSGVQGTNEGLFYPKRSIVVVFENGKTKDQVAWVDCKEAVDINGVKAGDSFAAIRSKLGNAPLIETWEGTPDHQVYRVEYYVPHAKIRFQSESENGDYSKVYILRM